MFSSKPKKQPARLHKVEEKSKFIKLCEKVLPVLFVLLFVLIIVFFVQLCFAVVPGPESNLYYYHIGDCV